MMVFVEFSGHGNGGDSADDDGYGASSGDGGTDNRLT